MTWQLMSTQLCTPAVGTLRSVGPIPPALCGLSSLLTLDLHSNLLSGEGGTDEV